MNRRSCRIRLLLSVLAALTALNVIGPSRYFPSRGGFDSSDSGHALGGPPRATRKETPSGAGRAEDEEMGPASNWTAAVPPKCAAPNHTVAWRYYEALVDANARTARRARELTAYAPARRAGGEGGGIPRVLVFTHRENLFNCFRSASISSAPDLHHLAENAKATVRAYREIWPGVEYVFLTDDECLDALNRTEPGLIPWFNGKLRGMYKADVCRAAYLYLHGGYYFDVDLLVVRPYSAPKDATFVTVKGDGYPKDGFFQAFLAAEKGSEILLKSLRIMLDGLWQERQQGKYLGPWATLEAWKEMRNVTDPSKAKNGEGGVYLLAETSLTGKDVARHEKLANILASGVYLDMLQRVPRGYGADSCQFSSGACDVVVVDEDETLYFYSRVLGTTWCGKRNLEDGECTTMGRLRDRVAKAREYA